jgi:hypothetical protein
MADDQPAPLPARRYNETDTDAILRRAAELAAGSEEKSAQRGLTIEEMESLAGEAGLDPELVRRAAREVAIKRTQRAAPFAGAPNRVLLEREIPGEISEEVWESMVGEVQGLFGAVGFASRVGRTRSWSLAPTSVRGPQSRLVTLSATTHQGKTVLRLDESLSQLAGALFGGIMGGGGGGTIGIWMGIGMGVLHSPAAAVSMVLLSVLGSYTVARKLFVRAYRKRVEELNDLLNRVVEARPLDGP